ncbi:MAG: peptidylprolyl isomerase [Flammeovirgaceae bacterium]|nr:peptidylprolyl isomerase [Flammeovirgaceae bacterium]
MNMKFINEFLNKVLKIALFLSFFLTLHIVNGQGDGVIVDKIIAKVDNYIVLKSELENAYLGQIANGGTPGPNARCQILQQLIVNKILVAKAEIDSILVEDAMVDGELDRRMQYFILQAGSEEKLEKTLGKKVSELRDELKDQVWEQLTAQRMQQEITSGVSVTPAQVKKFYNRLPKDSIPFLSAEVKVGQIVKFPEVSKAEKDKTKQALLELKTRIESGEEFGELARTFSEDYGSAKTGGDLGWHGRGELVPEFEATALRIEPNEIADPIESEFGFHLIQLLERRGNQFRARHILMRPKSNSNDMTQAISLLDSVRNLIVQDSMTFENAAKEFSDDQATRANAGFFKDQRTGSSIVSTESLDPVIFFTVDTMKVGTLSQPMAFRTEDGKNAVRMLYYEKYTPPHFANLKEDYQKMYVASLNGKKAEVLDKWLKTAKREVFIDIDQEYNQCNIKDEL